MERPTHARAPAREDASPSFSDFCGLWPGPLQADRAQRAWDGLDHAEKRAAVAAVSAGWCERWRAAQSATVAMIGAGTFLEGRRWREHAAVAPASRTSIDEQQAEMIRSGKTYLLRNVSAARGRELLALGLVTAADLARVGLE